MLLGICTIDNDGSVKDYTRLVPYYTVYEICQGSSNQLYFFVLWYRESIQHLINKRIGVDNFLDRIHHIYKTEYYSQASKAPEVSSTK